MIDTRSLYQFAKIFPPRTSLAQLPTPLTFLKRASQELQGPRIWIKRDDLTGSVLSGNKVRKLEFVVAQALSEGCDTLITCGGIQSNHCRATAFIAAQLGLQSCLILRNDAGEELTVDGNVFLDCLAGAEVHLYDPKIYRKQLSQLLVHHQELVSRSGGKGFIIPTGASDEIGVWGYVAACAEIKKDCIDNNIRPDAIIVATGSGGTHAGLTAGAYLYGLEAPVIGMAVCDSERYFIDKVTTDLSLWRDRYQVDIDINTLAISVNDQYIGPGYGKASAGIFETIQWLANKEGIVLDPVYTGKAFHGLISEIKAGNFRDAKDIVFIHTGGIFGLFAQKNNFNYSLKAITHENF